MERSQLRPGFEVHTLPELGARKGFEVHTSPEAGAQAQAILLLYSVIGLHQHCSA